MQSPNKNRVTLRSVELIILKFRFLENPISCPLLGLSTVKVECGSQFSVALSSNGSVYTWGKGDYHRLGHGVDEHVRRPKKVMGLQGKKVICVATGNLDYWTLCLACI